MIADGNTWTSNQSSTPAQLGPIDTHETVYNLVNSKSLDCSMHMCACADRSNDAWWQGKPTKVMVMTCSFKDSQDSQSTTALVSVVPVVAKDKLECHLLSERLSV
jgi:hypothetical protein